MKPTLLVLAAGMGSRYGGLKQLDQVGPSGETIMEYSVFDAIRSGFGKVVFIIRRDIESDFKHLFGTRFSKHIDVQYVFQQVDAVPHGIVINPERQKPWGTGHAVLMAKNAIDEPFAVINADDFYGYGTFRSLAAHLTSPDFAGSKQYALAGFMLQNTLSEYGSVSRGICTTDKDGYLTGIKEMKNIRTENTEIKGVDENGASVTLNPKLYVSMNAWALGHELFQFLENQFREFIQANCNDLKAEFYLPSFADTLIQRKIARFKILPVTEKWFGVTYREDKSIVEDNILKLVKMGIYPEKLWE